MVLVVPIDINGVTIEGLIFRATAMRTRPDENVTFQLEYTPPFGKTKGGAFARVEWKPLRPHNNKMIGPAEYQNLPQSGTHNHDFFLNWDHSKSGVAKGLLPISTPVKPDLLYDEIVAFVGKEFKISNINSLPKPEWSGTLF
jgi:hypothetical protein